MRNWFRSRFLIAVCAAAFALSGCARFSVKTGKAVPSLSGLERGKTTRQEILDRYGPPQVVDDTRGGLYGENHLAYEERKALGWYVMFYTPLGGLPFIGFFTAEETAHSTVFLFDEAGTLIDFASTQAPVGKRLGWSLLAWVYSGMLIK